MTELLLEDGQPVRVGGAVEPAHDDATLVQFTAREGKPRYIVRA